MKYSPNILRNESIRIETPVGTLTLIIVENKDGTINQFQLFLGKAGTEIFALVNGIMHLMNLLVVKGATIEDIMIALSNITGDRLSHDGKVRSVMEGIWKGLMRYRQTSNLIEQDTSVRGASVAPWARMRVHG